MSVTPRIRAFLTLALAAAFSGLAVAADGDALKDPIVHGAWLYRGKCVSCHRDYETSRLAAPYDTKKDLSNAIGEGGCQISWASKVGGELRRSEIGALVAYFVKWEKEQEEPDLPELPAQPKPVIQSVPQKGPKKNSETSAQKDPFRPALMAVLKKNKIAYGGYLYTKNCYRCHLTYEQGRMGRGLSTRDVNRFVKEGKTSTQMTPFSRTLGGPLKKSEIDAIVGYVNRWEEAGESPAIAPELLAPPSFSANDFKPMRLSRYTEIAGDNSAGKSVYRRNCSRCHGMQARGYIGPALSRQIWVTRPDLYMKSVIKSGIPGSLMRPWEVNKQGNLSPKDVEDLVGYLRHRQGEEKRRRAQRQ